MYSAPQKLWGAGYGHRQLGVGWVVYLGAGVRRTLKPTPTDRQPTDP